MVYKNGEPYGLMFSEGVKAPTPTSGQVLLKARAAAINPVDMKLQEFAGVSWYLQGKCVGLDTAGVVVQAPAGSPFKTGDAVFGFAKGALAEEVLCPVAELFRKPNNVSFAEAASFPTVAITALQCFTRNKLTRGEDVLVIGASGGVGTAAVQIGKILGARVTGICGTDNVELVKTLGADEVIDYKKQDVSKLDKTFDLILDTVTSTDPKDTDYESMLSKRCLKPGIGRYVAINSKHPSDFVRAMVSKNLGWNLQRGKYDLVMAEHKQEDLKQLVEWIEEGTLKPLLHEGATLPFTAEGVRQGFNLLKSRRAKGKVVFDVAEANSRQ